MLTTLNTYIIGYKNTQAQHIEISRSFAYYKLVFILFSLSYNNANFKLFQCDGIFNMIMEIGRTQCFICIMKKLINVDHLSMIKPCENVLAFMFSFFMVCEFYIDMVSKLNKYIISCCWVKALG